MDMRRNYVIVKDTETCPINPALTVVDPANMLVYDDGWVVADTRGNIYRERSFIAEEIFFGCTNLMQSAYYANKLPKYMEEIAEGKRIVVPFFRIREILLEDMAEFGTNIVVAHNARFDVGALNNTARVLTNSRYTRYFPNTIEVWDTMKMAQDTICKQKSYRKWCEEHGEMTKNNQVRKTAQALYRYAFGQWDFEESHTALEDVMIESAIMAKCFAQHKSMRKVLYPAKI